LGSLQILDLNKNIKKGNIYNTGLRGIKEIGLMTQKKKETRSIFKKDTRPNKNWFTCISYIRKHGKRIIGIMLLSLNSTFNFFEILKSYVHVGKYKVF
jgi:hypothetical protein